MSRHRGALDAPDDEHCSQLLAPRSYCGNPKRDGGPCRHHRGDAAAGTPLVVFADAGPEDLVAAQTFLVDDAMDSLLSRAAVRRVGQAFAAAGHELYLVGGSVRDVLSGADPSDLDFTTSARPEEIEAILSPLGTIWGDGRAFGTIAARVAGEDVEVTTFRADRYDGETRKPTVSYGDTVEDDLVRRDFTVNAMALRIGGDVAVIDPFGGVEDLEAGILRTPRDALVTMREDPLRALRAIRFAATRAMALDAGLAAAVREVGAGSALDIVSRERKTAELAKVLKHGPQALAVALRLARDLGIEAELVGDLAGAGDDALRVLADAPAGAPVLGWLALDRLDAGTLVLDALRASLRALRLPGPEIDLIAGPVEDACRWRDDDDPLAAAAIVRRRSDEHLDALAALLALAAWDEEHAALGAARDSALALRAPLPIDGDDVLALGRSGPAVGAALRAVERAFLAAPDLGRVAALEIAAR